MKVLVIPSWYVTEDRPLSGIFFKEQACALEAAGLSVCVAYPDLRFRLGGLKRGLYRAEGEPRTFLLRRRTLTPFSERGRRPQIRAMLERLYREIEKQWGAPDIVHLHSCRIGIETLALCRRHGLPLVYTEHYSAVTGWMKEPLREEFEQTLRGCSRPVAVSRPLAQVMRTVRPDTAVIPNLTDGLVFRPSPVAHEGFVFAAMGGLTPVKNYSLLLHAFAQAAAGLPELRLTIAGGGPLRDELARQIARLGLKDRATLAGPVQRADAPAFYNACDCLVCSSDTETFGMTLIEALSCGVPLIATRCGGPEDIVNGENGFLVSPGDEKALAGAMKRMVLRRGGFDASKLRNDCMERFGARSVTERLIGLYREVLAEGR